MLVQLRLGRIGTNMRRSQQQLHLSPPSKECSHITSVVPFLSFFHYHST
jgi:hypothetical protein